VYISKEVGCVTFVANPPLTRNCEREDSIDYTTTGHVCLDISGKVDGKIALKPGNFGMPPL